MAARAQAQPYSLVFFLVLLIGMGGLCFIVLRPFLTAIAWGIVLAVALWPLWRRLKARAPQRSALAAAAFSVCAGLVVFLPAGLIGKAIANQASAAVTALGDKLRAREAAQRFGLPLLPGSEALTGFVLHPHLVDLVVLGRHPRLHARRRRTKDVEIDR